MRIVIISMAASGVASAIPLLESLGHETAAVLTMRSRRTGDGTPEVIAAVPEEIDVAVLGSPTRLAPLLRMFDADLALCNGFGWKIGADALASTRLGIVNGHPSLLPRWRGPNPFGWTFRSGDPEVGFTFHVMDEGFDTGPILAQGSLPLGDEDTMDTLRERVHSLFGELLPRALARIESGDRGDPQPDVGVTYAANYEDAYAEIDWTRPAREVHNQIRAWFTPTVSGIMGPLTTLDGERVRVLESRLVDAAHHAAPGDVLVREADGTVVACGSGAVRVLRTEPAP
jgi:methionyl-tRNA formyltransferase